MIWRANKQQEHGGGTGSHCWDVYPPTRCNQSPWSCAQASGSQDSVWEQLSWPTAAGHPAKGIESVPGLRQVCSRKKVPSPNQRTTKKEKWLFIKGLAQTARNTSEPWGSKAHGDFWRQEVGG